MISQMPEEGLSYLSPLMTITQKTGPSDVRVNNRMMIFNLLFPSTPLSRAEIGRRTGLSRVSVSEVVSNMIDGHFLREAGQETPSRRGKKGTLVSVDTSYWNIIAIDLSQPFIIQGAVTNILGHILAHAEQPVERATDITPEMVEDLCRRLIEKTTGRIMGIGVTLSGVVDDRGTVIDSRNLDWSNLPLGSMIEDTFGLPVFIDNDANSALLTERFFGDGTPNMIFVQVSIGVGTAALIDDSIVMGTNHAAGEIGHVVVDPSGPVCVCGKRGCLETFISVPILRERISEDADHKTEILTEAGNRLGQALSMPASLLDLNDIAVFGPPDVVNDTFISAAEKTINEATFSMVQERPITVRLCECGSSINIQGESLSVLQTLLRRM